MMSHVSREETLLVLVVFNGTALQEMFQLQLQKQLKYVRHYKLKLLWFYLVKQQNS